MIKQNAFGGAIEKMAPLISFDMIIDTDMGLINLIKNEYLDPTVFEISFFDQSMFKILLDLYKRRVDNPLELFAKEGIPKVELDGYYKEFKETCYEKILSYSISTEIYNLIGTFNTVPEITSTILCYNQAQLDILKNETKLSQNSKILLSELTDIGSLNQYEQFFFKWINEAYPFINLVSKSFYFATHGLNISDKKSDIKTDDGLIIELTRKKNNINVLDMYDIELIERKIKNV